MFQLQLIFLLHCDEWDRVVALTRHKFVTGATLLQLGGLMSSFFSRYLCLFAYSGVQQILTI